MARSLKVIGAVIISVVMSSASALSSVRGPVASMMATPVTTSSSSSSSSSSSGSWGLPITNHHVDVVRRVPETSVGCSRMWKMSATTLDRPTSTTTPTRTTSSTGGGVGLVEKKAMKDRERTGSDAWEVRIYNDVKNTREFVSRCLVQIVGLSETFAYQTMMQAHKNGLAAVGTYAFERAEMYHEALTENGIMCDMIPVDEDRK